MGVNAEQAERWFGLIFILAAASPIGFVYVYALETGMTADTVTAFYAAGLLAGTVLMSLYRLPGGDRGQGRGRSKPGTRLIVACILVAGIVLAIYPVRLYAPEAKALYAPLVYWAGVILGTTLVWVAAWPLSARNAKYDLER